MVKVGLATSCLLVSSLMFAGFFFAAVSVLPMNTRATTLFVGGLGPGNYTSVQAGIDAANSGDTVFIFNGTYSENIRIEKTLSIVGQAKKTTVIDGIGAAPGIAVAADWVNLTGLTVTRSGPSRVHPAIALLGAHNCRIYGNNASNAWFGIELESSGSNLIANNTVFTSTESGIYLFQSSDNSILNNTVYDGDYGIYLFESSSDVVANNVMFGGGIHLGGYQLDEWSTHTIDTSNTVNGRPVYYWRDADGGTIPTGAGQVILANSKNVAVEHQNLSEVTVGIELGFSSDIVITESNLSHNGWGIFVLKSFDIVIANATLLSNIHGGIELQLSYDIRVVNNAISNGGVAISITVSNNVTLAGNAMAGNGIIIDGWALRNWASHTIEISNTVNGKPVQYWKDAVGGEIPAGAGQVVLANCTGVSVKSQYFKNAYVGIMLGFSVGNIIFNNTFSNNGIGVLFESSHDNTLYHNNFIANYYHLSTPSGNVWDDGYPAGGNYWSDYGGSDSLRGPNQDQPGNDGIGDTPYQWEGFDLDKYPLAYPFGLPSSPRSLKATPGSNQVVLSWLAPASDGGSPITGYAIYRGNASGRETLLVTIGNVFTYTDTGLTNGETYYYRVTASNNVGEGLESNEISATITLSPSEQPIPVELWIWLVVAITIVGLLVTASLTIRKRRGKRAEEEPPETETTSEK